MSKDAESNIWVFLEQRENRLADVGLELLGISLGLAEEPNWKVGGVLVGQDLGPLIDRILPYGLDELLVADHPLLEDYCNETYAKVIESAVREFHPAALLFGATAMGTDLAPRLAAKLRTGLSAHCIDLALTKQGELAGVVPWPEGNLMAHISCPRTRPQMATVIPGIFNVPEKAQARGKVIQLQVNLGEKDRTYRIVETNRDESRSAGLGAADVVVAGGWGIGREEDWRLIEELAAALNGAVGATRPAVDDGWADEDKMIGQSGRTVSPRLYIGVGVSGHMHHMVGIKETELAVGINRDPGAAIFEHCDVGLVGDFRKIVPELIKAIKSYSESNRATSEGEEA
jgi:electron transfer flavoprotein alpha subunit